MVKFRKKYKLNYLIYVLRITCDCRIIAVLLYTITEHSEKNHSLFDVSYPQFLPAHSCYIVIYWVA